jgi:hypothetical protein
VRNRAPTLVLGGSDADPDHDAVIRIGVSLQPTGLTRGEAARRRAHFLRRVQAMPASGHRHLGPSWASRRRRYRRRAQSRLVVRSTTAPHAARHHIAVISTPTLARKQPSICQSQLPPEPRLLIKAGLTEEGIAMMSRMITGLARRGRNLLVTPTVQTTPVIQYTNTVSQLQLH